MNKLLYFSFLLLIFISCNPKKKEYISLLEQARTIRSQHRDSAKILLDSIFEPKLLGKKNYADYVLLNLELKYLLRQDIVGDTAIFKVLEYFQKQKDTEQTIASLRYIAKVYTAQKEYEKALKAYLDAEIYAEKSQTKEWKSTIQSEIGDLYEEQEEYEEALKQYKLALAYLDEDSHYSNKVVYYNNIGHLFLFKKGQIDSAQYYFDKSIQLLKDKNDSIFLASTKLSIGNSYRKSNDYALAKKEYLEAHSLWKDEERKANLEQSLGYTYFFSNMNDSARYYFDKYLDYLAHAQRKNDGRAVYNILSAIESQEGNYQQALEYYRQHIDYRMESLLKEKDTDLRIFQKRYNYEQLKNENNELLIERQYIYILSLFLSIVILVICFFFYRKMMKQKNHLLKEQTALLEAEQQIGALKSMAESFNEKENSLKNEVIKHFDILKKVAALNENKLFFDEKEDKKRLLSQVNKIVYGQKEGFNWDIFFNSINVLYGNEIERINQSYQQLDNTELKICYLSYAGFSNSETSTLLGLALNTIQQKKSNIRKKIGVPEHGNLQEFLIQELNFSGNQE